MHLDCIELILYYSLLKMHKYFLIENLTSTLRYLFSIKFTMHVQYYTNILYCCFVLHIVIILKVIFKTCILLYS